MSPALLFVLASAGIVLAQDDGETAQGPDFNRRTDFSCQNWNAQARGGDRALMARLAGEWRANNVIPGTPGLIGNTPEQVVLKQWASGEITVDKYACFEPFGQQRACATSISQGRWFAYPAGQDGTFFYATALSGSSYTGGYLPPSCGGVYARFQDANTTVNQYGGVAHRTGPAQ